MPASINLITSVQRVFVSISKSPSDNIMKPLKQRSKARDKKSWCSKLQNCPLFASSLFLKNGGRYCVGVCRRLCRRFALYLIAIKASVLIFAMFNICKNSIAKIFFDFFKI